MPAGEHEVTFEFASATLAAGAAASTIAAASLVVLAGFAWRRRREALTDLPLDGRVDASAAART
ncbi:hypothetical protein D3C83_110740 [compost metagenome]